MAMKGPHFPSPITLYAGRITNFTIGRKLVVLRCRR